MLNFSDKDRKLYTVFAFDNDRYYTDSLLELNKEQYLWLSLRSSHDHVWFLSVQENKKIDIMCFDDKPTNVELKSRKKLLGLKDPFEWFKEQSKQNGSQAFVMDKDSFRNLFSKKYCRGTIRNPPPTPKSPDAKPAHMPIKIKPIKYSIGNIASLI